MVETYHTNYCPLLKQLIKALLSRRLKTYFPNQLILCLSSCLAFVIMLRFFPESTILNSCQHVKQHLIRANIYFARLCKTV